MNCRMQLTFSVFSPPLEKQGMRARRIRFCQDKCSADARQSIKFLSLWNNAAIPIRVTTQGDYDR